MVASPARPHLRAAPPPGPSPSDASAPTSRDAGAGEVPGPSSLRSAVLVAARNFRAQNMGDHAAALTYYAIMSLFPALLIAVSMLGIFGEQRTVNDIVGYLSTKGASRDLVNALRSSLDATVSHASATVSIALVGGIAVALWGASGAFAAAGRALNVVYGVSEDRGTVRRRLADLGSTLVVIVLSVVMLVLVFLGGGVARDVLGTIGLGSTAADAFNVLRWPLATAVAMAIYAFVYALAPDIRPRRFRWLSPGATAGVLLWIAGSAGFFIYISHFGQYRATYGAFAGAVILLLWLWLSSVALLFGAELNAALEPGRARPGAQPPPA